LRNRIKTVCRTTQQALMEVAVREAEALMHKVIQVVRNRLDGKQIAVFRAYLEWGIAFRVGVGSPFAQLAHMRSLERLFGPEFLSLVGQLIPGVIRRSVESNPRSVSRWWKPAASV